MGTYLAPTTAPVSDDYWGHRNRNPPSPEPGTDYACAYGTDLAMAEAGTVSVVDHSPGGGEGRRLSVDLDDGRRVSYIHLSPGIKAWVGMRVSRGQQGVAFSGASGQGDDWYYGPHVHVSLWEVPGQPYSQSIDFEAYVGDLPLPILEGDEMYRIQATNRGIGIIGPGYYRHLYTSEEVANSEAIITKHLDGTDREYDLWRSMALQGEGAPVPLAAPGSRSVSWLHVGVLLLLVWLLR